jgi:flagellar motor switch protein FliN/FliY
MSVFTAEISQQIVETCTANVAAIAEPLNSNFGAGVEASVGELLSGQAAAFERSGNAAGIAVTFRFGSAGAACLIPENLPIPDWYRSPSEGQANQIQTLGMEWSMGLFPPHLEATEYGSAATQSLRQQLEALAPADDASVLELPLKKHGADEPHSSLLLVWPLTNPVLESAAPWPVSETAAGSAANQPASVPEPVAAVPPSLAPLTAAVDGSIAERQHRSRVLNVPVDLTVLIAAKKVDISQLRNITPGMLITFNKSCEALLDVFVGDRLKFRGEAVKVGERFGIKINEANAQVVREQRVHRI